MDWLENIRLDVAITQALYALKADAVLHKVLVQFE